MAIYKIAALSITLLFGSIAFLAFSGSASALPVAGQEIPDISSLTGQNPLALQVDHRRRRGHYRGGRRYGQGFYRYRYGYRGGYYRYYRQRHGPRYRHRRRGYGHFYGGWWYSLPWWGGTGVYSNRGGHRYGGNYNAHVEYCLNRYRSYNVRTDQFLGYDGYYHYCNSPYR